METRHAAQRRRQIAQVRKAGAEADGINGVLRLAVRTNDFLRGEAGIFGHASQIKLELVAARNLVTAHFWENCRACLLGVNTAKSFYHLRVGDFVQIEENRDTGVSLDD